MLGSVLLLAYKLLFLKPNKLTPQDQYMTKHKKLVVLWQLEIEDLAHLEKAQELANGGTINDLTAAVAEAQIIPADHPSCQRSSKRHC